ncbi:hypothetical protein [Pseudomonas poae]|uniref:hypothetical protein n=1 Tax=Pseudomonas poae TaxID=200451 RepID=UPI000F04221D
MKTLVWHAIGLCGNHFSTVYHEQDIHRPLFARGCFHLLEQVWIMNSPSFESRQAQYTLTPLPSAACEGQKHDTPLPQGLNLTSTPKFSFKAPTAEDFDKGSKTQAQEPGSGSAGSLLASIRNLLSRRA